MLDARSWILDAGCWIRDEVIRRFGFYPGSRNQNPESVDKNREYLNLLKDYINVKIGVQTK